MTAPQVTGLSADSAHMDGMQGIGVAGLSAFVLTSLAVGLRLMALYRRTRQFPELAMGLSFFTAGFLSTAMNLVGNHAQDDPTVAMWLRLAAALISYSGYALMAFFVWRVFRRDTAGALLFAVCAGLLAAGFVMQVLSTRPVLPAPIDPGFWVAFAGQVIAYGWPAAEALHYWTLLRRRQRIGLAEPLMVNRFLMWGIANATVVGIWGEVAYSMAGQAAAVMSDASYLRLALLGFACAATTWLAFFPPRAYARRFERARP